MSVPTEAQPTVAVSTTIDAPPEAVYALVADLPHPLLAFCRSGARSTRLYQLATGG